METRSKTRADTMSHPESVRATPEAPVQRASSESSFDLTVLLDDGVTGVVGPGQTAGERPSRLSGITLQGQGQVAAGIEPVSEPMQQSPHTGIRERILAESLCGDAPSSIPTFLCHVVPWPSVTFV